MHQAHGTGGNGVRIARSLSTLTTFTSDNCDVICFSNALNSTVNGLGLEAHAFKVDWYNSFRAEIASDHPQLLHIENRDAVGFIVISNRSFFREVVKTFDPESQKSNFVDATVDSILDSVIQQLDPSLRAKGWNTDKPPYFHVQTIGHVSGLDQYVPGQVLGEQSESSGEFTQHRDPQIWGSLTNRVLGVSVHPKYGGWYAYRMLLVLEGVSWPSERTQPKSVDFLTPAEKALIIREYNQAPDMGRWRDVNGRISPLVRYDVAQFLYFHEKSTEKRRRILQLLKEEMRVDK